MKIILSGIFTEIYSSQVVLKEPPQEKRQAVPQSQPPQKDRGSILPDVPEGLANFGRHLGVIFAESAACAGGHTFGQNFVGKFV
jgi:hypothetical protein